MPTQPLGMILIVTGLVLLVVGLLFYFGGAWPFSYLGRLPGDIRIERDHVRFYFPIVTSILLSLLLTLILFIISKMR